MKDQFHKNGIWVLIAALFLTSAITLGSALLPNLTSPLTNAIGVLASPFRGVTTPIANWLGGIYDYTFHYQEMETKLAETEEELADVRSQLREAQDAIQENDDLRAALGLVQEKTDLTLVDVTVTGDSSTSYESTMTLSKGSNADIAVGDCVITGTGYLVGVVRQVGVNWCRVITVIDPDISVSAEVYRTETSVMLESDLNLMQEGRCKLTYMDVEEGVSFVPGDEVLTTGANGTYPSGLVIGYVESVQTTASGLEHYAVVEPAADLDALDTIFVVTDFDND